MDRHLPTIHKIMCKPVRDGQLRSVEHFNEILSTQINKVLQQRQLNRQTPMDSENSEAVPPSNQTVMSANGNSDVAEPSRTVDSGENIQCPRCKKNCCRRSAFCELGSHWIHYGCDRLTETDIQRLSNDKGYIYNCKRCAVSENTLPKQPIGPNLNFNQKSISPDVAIQTSNIPDTVINPEQTSEVPVPTRQTSNAPDISVNLNKTSVGTDIVMPAMPSNEPNRRTQAEAILDEEGDTMCAVCLAIITDTPNRCSKCLAMCHESCLDTTDGDSDPSICHSCCAAEAQISNQVICPDNSVNTSQAEYGSTTILTNVPQNDVTGSGSDANSNPIPQGTAVNQGSGQRKQGGPTAKSSLTSTSSRDKTTTDKAAIKLREVRQLEGKLKKWEEDLKIREAKLNNNSVDARRMEEYLSRTEARNVELEDTVRTLQRKIFLLENEFGNLQKGSMASTDRFDVSSTAFNTANMPAQGPTNDYQDAGQQFLHNKETNDLVIGLHQQVTRFVLNKVSRQLTQLEMLDQSNDILYNTRPQPSIPSHGNLPFQANYQSPYVLPQRQYPSPASDTRPHPSYTSMNQTSGPTPRNTTSDQATHAQWTQNQPTSSSVWTDDRPKQGASLQRRSVSRKSGSDKRGGNNLHVTEACQGTNYGPAAMGTGASQVRNETRNSPGRSHITTQVAGQPVFYSSQPLPALPVQPQLSPASFLEMSRPARVRR